MPSEPSRSFVRDIGDRNRSPVGDEPSPRLRQRSGVPILAGRSGRAARRMARARSIAVRSIAGWIGGLTVMAGFDVAAAAESEPPTFVVEAPRRAARPRALELAPHRQVVFLNFDGQELVYDEGVEDAAANKTFLPEMAGTFAPYGDGPKRDAVLEAVRADFADYDIVVTGTRPVGGEYVMAMVGPTSPYGAGTRGIAGLDCGDRWSRRNIVFAFFSSDDDYGVADTAGIIGQEIAHGFGLDHVDDPRDIMHPRIGPGDATFLDECLAVMPATTSEGVVVDCMDDHRTHCEGAGQQNARRELLARFGPARPDLEAPQAEIVGMVPGPATITIEAEVFDDGGLAEVALLEGDGRIVGLDSAEPFAWKVPVATGRQRFTVEAVDFAGNVANSSWVEIEVELGNGGEPRIVVTWQDEAEAGWDRAAGCRVDGRGRHPPAFLLPLVFGLLVRRRARARG